MTDLLIQLPDDPSRDDVHCGACPHLDLINVRCRLRFGSTRGLRLPACVEAEAQAARCVEIEPDLVRRAAIDCIVPNTIAADAQEAASELEAALREHGRKANG